MDFRTAVCQMEPIRVAIVEDKDEIREALRVLINGSIGYECVLTFPDAESAVATLPTNPVDAVIMDIHLPGITGDRAVAMLKPVLPDTQFMMFTIFDDDDHIFNALQAGATGYILKGTPPAKILNDIKDIVNGHSPMSGAIARRVIENMHRGMRIIKQETENLSSREIEILEHLQKGLMYKEIADKLFISKDTIKKHIQHIYKKLHVQTRMEAVNKTFRH